MGGVDRMNNKEFVEELKKLKEEFKYTSITKGYVHNKIDNLIDRIEVRW